MFAIANIVLVIWALVDAIRVPDESMYRAGNKLIWVLVILLAGFIGAIVYFFIGRPARRRAFGDRSGARGSCRRPRPVRSASPRLSRARPASV